MEVGMTNILRNLQVLTGGAAASAVSGADSALDQRIQETEHRIKNHLQLISSSLAIQARGAVHSEARELLLQAYGRVSAVARLHARFQNMVDVGAIQVAPFLSEVCADLSICFNASGAAPVALEVNFQARTMSAADALTLGLIVNELVTNAVKHASPGARVLVRVQLHEEGRSWRLTVSDNGRGIPFGAFDAGASLGARLLHALAAHVSGKLVLDPVTEGGSVSIVFD
jgi:two-component sensor histidine kinase